LRIAWDLPDIYIKDAILPSLKAFFPSVLDAVIKKGGHEVIFIDGLDQIEGDQNGKRDLTFLPLNPPKGIVFVLGTRPDDTLKPLKALKPSVEYELPDLSRQDFDLILAHRNVQLDKRLADRLHLTLHNALYLDLAARELIDANESDLVTLLQKISDDPDNIFTFSIERLKQHGVLWDTVIYPLLGVLLCAREPLAARTLGDILKLEIYKIRDGLAFLGGLVAVDGQQ